MTKSLEKFGQDFTSKTRTIDVNGDGYEDRIIERCDGGTNGSCVATQLEMGLSDGSFVPVYEDDPALSPQVNDVLHFGPEFFADMADGEETGLDAIAEPGAVAGKAIRDGAVKDEYDLMGMCFESEIGPALGKCVEQAKKYPSEHIFQSPALFRKKGAKYRSKSSGVENVSASDMRLDYEGSMYATGQDPENFFNNSWQNVVGAGSVVSEFALAMPLHELYSPFELPQNPLGKRADFRRHKLRQNVILDVKSGRSDDLGEYFYAHTLGVIGDEELSAAVVRLHKGSIISDSKIGRRDLLGIMGLEGEVDELFGEDPDNMVSPELVLKKVIKAKKDEQLRAARRGLVLSIVEELKSNPDLVGEFSLLVDAVDDIAMSYPEIEGVLKADEDEEGGKDVIFGGGHPRDEAREEDPEAGSWKIPVGGKYATYGVLKKIFGGGSTEVTLKDNPDILWLLPGLGEKLSERLELEVEFLEGHPSISEAWAKIRMIESGGTLSGPELASLKEKSEFIAKISGQKPWATVERIALEDDSLMASLSKGQAGDAVDTGGVDDFPDDADLLLTMLNSSLSNPAMSVGSIDPTIDDAEALKRKVEGVKMDWLRVRMLAKRLSDVDPDRFIGWAYGLKRDVERGRMVDGRSFKEVMDLAIAVSNDNTNIRDLLSHYTKLALRPHGALEPDGKKRDPFKMVDEIIPTIKMLITKVGHPYQLPDVATILRLGERHKSLRSAALMALGKKGDASVEVKDWIRKTIRDRWMCPEIRAASAQAALLLGDEKAVPYLAMLMKHEDFRVRYAACEALKLRARSKTVSDDLVGPPTGDYSVDTPVYLAKRQSPSAEVIDAMKDGVLDADARVAFTASVALVEWGVPDVARILTGKLERYREDIKTIRAARSNDPYATLTELSYAAFLGMEENLEESYAMNTPLMPAGVQRVKKEDLPTLKRLTLQAIAKFGQPRNAFPMLAEMLMEDQGEIELGMTAQALVTLKQVKGLRLIYDRLEEKSPDSLIAYAAGVTAELKRRGEDVSEFTPRLAHYLHHKEERVRTIVAKSLNALNDDRALAFVIESSHEDDPKIRLHMAEALPYFDCAESAERTIELIEDENEDVRVVALTALDKYKTEGALSVIKRHIYGDVEEPAVDEQA